MKIINITVENVKGLSRKSLEFALLPNRPNLLVAPNGFGKSSIATAFSSMNSNRLQLSEEHFHNGDENLPPKLEVTYLDPEGVSVTLEATSRSNTISTKFDWLVINNLEKAKGVGQNFGDRTTVRAFLSIEPIVLVNTIPERVNFVYSCTGQRELFGRNGKVLPNINELLSNRIFIESISTDYSFLERALGVRVSALIDSVTEEVNTQNGTVGHLRDWISSNCISRLRMNLQLSAIADRVRNADSGGVTDLVDYLSAFQIIQLYRADKSEFKKACKFSNFKLEKSRYADILTAFNSSSQMIEPRERRGKLVVEFPKTNLISNGERDILSFVCMMLYAKRKLKKRHCILIIDEVFDYLDDANLVAAQYYITKLIKEFKQKDRVIFPLIFTHLNPYYFRNYTFSKQREFYLLKSTVTPNASMVNLLRKRDDTSIIDDVSKYLLHFNPGSINKRTEFQALGLKEKWGESDNFSEYTIEELERYCSGQRDCDPLAICCAVRCKIEKKVFNALPTLAEESEFLRLRTTRKKLEYAQSKGVEVPESFFLLGIIYNEGMHWKENRDNISPIVAKLENRTIQYIINGII